MVELPSSFNFASALISSFLVSIVVSDLYLPFNEGSGGSRSSFAVVFLGKSSSLFSLDLALKLLATIGLSKVAALFNLLLFLASKSFLTRVSDP